MRTVTFLAHLTALAALCQGAAPPPPVLTEAEVGILIRQLGSDDYKTREEATRRLLRCEEAEPALRRALRSSDPAVISQARSILDTFAQRREQRARERFGADAVAGRADLLAERVVRWRGASDDAVCWQAVLDLGLKLRALDQQSYRRLAKGSNHDVNLLGTKLADYVEKYKVLALPAERPMQGVSNLTLVQSGPTSGRYLARGERVSTPDPNEGKLVAASLITATREVYLYDVAASIVLCGGPVTVKSGSGLIVVCDGEFVVKQWLWDSIVIVRGGVRCDGGTLTRCVLLAGDVGLDKRTSASQSTIRSTGTISVSRYARVRDCDLKDGVKDALAPIKFFEPRDVGVEVAPSRLGVRVTKATGVFARAGLRADDLVLSLDGAAARTPDIFRRLLRGRLAEGGEAVFQVRREGETLAVRGLMDQVTLSSSN